ncbi:hypothetical protein [Paraflavitalea sp. CAU 1676]|uniref:hypothetical protein n=1 Tax=Paraflavitalea sp. CAU 1676 TaxID=3032598 RepID=UPI0023DA9523|nr:hypothetical protein [Paraflavitalea sp. CAU 1676]MDF2189328.1 hypothetical protein [Paraflavitalea sp. CAU 1676]
METVTKKKSEALAEQEFKALQTYRARFGTSVACATSIGIDRNVLERVMLTGSGSPETIAKIKLALGF